MPVFHSDSIQHYYPTKRDETEATFMIVMNHDPIKVFRKFLLRFLMIFLLFNISHYFAYAFHDCYEDTLYYKYKINHLNDIQIILVWFIFSFLYIFTIQRDQHSILTVILIFVSLLFNSTIIFILLWYYNSNNDNIDKILFNNFNNDIICYTLYFDCDGLVYFTLYDLIHTVIGLPYIIFSSIIMMSLIACCINISGLTQNKYKLYRYSITDSNASVNEYKQPLVTQQDTDRTVITNNDDDEYEIETDNATLIRDNKSISYMNRNDIKLNVFHIHCIFSLILVGFLAGIAIINHIKYDILHERFYIWYGILLVFIWIFKNIFSFIGVKYDKIRADMKRKGLFSYDISIELLLVFFVKSFYSFIIKVYLIYIIPKFIPFIIVMFIDIITEYYQYYFRATNYYYIKTTEMIHKYKCLKCIRFDNTKFDLWRERFAIDINVKFVINIFSTLAALILGIIEYIVLKSKKCQSHHRITMNTNYNKIWIGITYNIALFISQFLLYFIHYKFVWTTYKVSKKGLIEPFTRLLNSTAHPKQYMWILIVTFLCAGLTYAGQSI